MSEENQQAEAPASNAVSDAQSSFVKASIGQPEEPTPEPAQEAEATDDAENAQESEAPEEQPAQEAETGEDGTVRGLRAEMDRLREQNRELKAARQAEEAARRVLAEQQAKQPPKQAQRPDPEVDPYGFEDAFARDLNASRLANFEQHGEKAIVAERVFDLHMNAGRISLEMQDRLRRSTDPVGEVIQWYDDVQAQKQQSSALERLKDYGYDLDAYTAAHAQASASPASQAAPDPKPRLTPDLTRGPGRGNGQGQVESGPRSSFVKASIRR